VQYAKSPNPIFKTFGGRVIPANDEQPANALSPMEKRLDGREMFVRD
jgi:hypothetical protein